jgi:hypothetical protein
LFYQNQQQKKSFRISVPLRQESEDPKNSPGVSDNRTPPDANWKNEEITLRTHVLSTSTSLSAR